MNKIQLGAELRDFRGETIREDMRVQVITQLYVAMIPDLPAEKQDEAYKLLTDARKPMTLWAALCQMMGAPLEGFTPDEIGRLFTLVAELAPKKAGEAELEAKDVTLLQKAIGKVYKQPLICGQINAMLDGKKPFGESEAAPAARE